MYIDSNIYSILPFITFGRACPHKTSEMIIYQGPTLGAIKHKQPTAHCQLPTSHPFPISPNKTMLSLVQYGGISECPQHLAYDSTGSVYNGNSGIKARAIMRFCVS